MSQNTRSPSTRNLSVLPAALAAAVLLAACTGKPSTPTSRPSSSSAGVPPPVAVQASSSPGLPSGAVAPSGIEARPALPSEASPGGLAPGLPEVPPTAAEARSAWQEGLEAYEARDYGTAGARLQIAAAGRPDDACVHYIHGLALWKSDHLVEAEAALERSTALDGASIKTWINLARVRMAREDAPGALAAADEALALDPGSADALHQRGRGLAGTGRIDEALEALQQARLAGPENGYIANTLGHLLLTRGRVDEAIPHLEAARDRLSGVAFVRNNLGAAYERRGDLDRAVEEYRAAVGAGDSGGKAAASLARLEPLAGPHIAADPGPEEEATGDGDASS